MSSPARGPRPPFAAASSARPILNLNRPGQAARRRSEDQQPSEASLSNRRPTAPPTIFPLSQVPTGPRVAQPSRQVAPAGPSSTPYAPRQRPRIKPKKRHTAGGWANSSASSSTSESHGPAHRDAGWGSRAPIAPSAAAIGGSDKGKAPDGMRGDGYAGRPIVTGASNPLPTPIPVPANPRCTLYITGLPSYTTEEDMYVTFSPFGQVTRVSVKSPKPNHTFAHIAFATANEALAAFEALDGRQPDFVSAPPPGAGAEAGSSRGMKITFAETTAERDYRRMSGGEAPPAPLGLFRVPQTPDPSTGRAESEVKPEPSPSPQKAAASALREGAGVLAGGPSRAGPQDPLPARILTPRLTFHGSAIPSIGHGSLTPPDDRIYRPTYLFMYEYARPLRSRPEREVIDELKDQLWRDHGRMRVEDWSIGPRYHTTVVRLRVSVPPETIDKYRLGERRKSDFARTATEPPEPQATPSSVEVRPAPTSMDVDAPDSSVDWNHAVLFDDAGIARFRAPLPDPARGSSSEANKQRRLFLIAQVKKLGAEGDKVVLSSRIEGEEVVIEYMQEKTEEDAGGEADGAEGAANVVDMNVAAPSRTAAGIDEAVAGDRAPEDVTEEVDAMQDVKPVIPAEENATSPAAIPIPAAPAETDVPRPEETAMAIDAAADHDQDEEVDELATPPPPPDAARFPLPALAESRADSKETYSAVTAFIQEYFRRFDESRSSLESFYTPNALFSIKINDRLPARLFVPPVNFSPHWISARNKVASTPVAITNTIRALPAVSHNVDRLTFTARTVPELHVKSKNRAPIVLHVVGQFEEFLEKTVRSFCRTFIIVPRPSKTMGGPSDGYLVHSDQLAVSYHVRDEPSPLLVQQPPFSPAKRPAASPAVTAPPVITTAPVTVAAGPSTRPFSQFQPHPALARMHEAVAGPSRILASAQAPRAAGSSAQPSGAQSDSDRIASSSPLSAPARPLPTPARSPREANESDSAHTSVSPEVERRPLPTSSAASAPRSAASLGKRRADEETTQPQRRKKRNADEPAAPLSASIRAAGTAAATASGAAAQSYTAADIERMVQREVAAQLALAGGSGRGPSPRSDADDEPVASTSDAASSSREGKKKRDKNDTSAKAKRAAATAAAATAETQKRKQQEKAKAAAAKAGPPLGTGLGTSDARILLTGGSQSLLHGFDGRSNKLRHMVDTGSSYLAVSHIGDIVEFAPSSLSLSTSIHKLHSSSNDTYRVDDFAWSDAKDTLVVGYLGVREGKTLAQPPNQVILYKKEPAANGSRLVERKVDLRPHKSGGVTALATLPGTGRLRFVTGGEDKQLYIWSRSRATQEYTAEEIRSDHSSMITSLAHLPERNWLVSSGKDKRLKAYDLEHLNSTWQALLHDPIMTVQSLSSDPNLVLARMSSSRDQFAAYDVRRPPTSAAVLTFGYDLAPHRSSKGALAATNMGRYFRGAQCDTIFAFPDYAQGVKLWDLRNVRDAQTQLDLKRQDVPDLGRGKVVQVAFRGRSEMCLMDLSHVTRAHIQG
ncbi:hypothetical protein JCM10908_000191 [Rhodotorula pacifica]|uniref:uncharacterized protein n=1 Tax=Rhodotorula pacifica TaxID=1495444 RepID=UPI003175A896